MTSKRKVIASIYCDRRGFNSRNNTLADAKRKYPSITMDDANMSFSTSVEQKAQVRGYNSFVAKGPQRISDGLVSDFRIKHSNLHLC